MGDSSELEVLVHCYILILMDCSFLHQGDVLNGPSYALADPFLL